MTKHLVTITLLSSITFSTNISLADPRIFSVSNPLTHKGTVTILGQGFGTKSPAPPLVWDDCEDKTLNDHRAVTSEGPWSEALPSNAEAEPNGDGSFNIMYRAAGWRNVPAPHSRSTKYLTGGHKEHGSSGCTTLGGFARGYNVGVTVPTTSTTIFSTWYYRLDPLWPSCGECGWNHKMDSKNSGLSMYDTPDQYFNYTNSNTPCREGHTLYLRMHDNWYGDKNGNPMLAPLHNPRLQWVRIEFRQKMMADDGFAWLGTDNVPSVNHTNFYWGHRPQSYSIGGFYRYSMYPGCCPDRGGTRVHDDAWRYFDDIYIDITMARVILANSPTYASATIIEPQIPIAWSDQSITVTVNLGALHEGQPVYLFVFDSRNICNEPGYPVSIQDLDHAPPSPPAGLRILQR